ncbi:hypothetical protein BDZ89DRAFT_1155264, partial [Hymenopellis radicata]
RRVGTLQAARRLAFAQLLPVPASHEASRPGDSRDKRFWLARCSYPFHSPIQLSSASKLGLPPPRCILPYSLDHRCTISCLLYRIPKYICSERS